MVIENRQEAIRPTSQVDWGPLQPHTGGSSQRRTQTAIVPKTVVLKNKRSWIKLFGDFTSLRGVTYVSSPGFLLDLFEEQGFEKVDLLVGHSLADTYKDQLSGEIGKIQHLFERIQSHSLRVRSSKATIHTKLYILENEDKTRVIVGSPNLSYTAQGSHQREYAWYVDVAPGDRAANDFLNQVEADFQQHVSESDIVEFMQDLADLRQNSENSADVDFRLWAAGAEDQDARVVRTIMTDIRAQAFTEDSNASEIIHINVPKNVPKRTRNQLRDAFGAKFAQGSATMNRSSVLETTEVRGVPLLEIDTANGDVLLGIGASVDRQSWTGNLTELNQGLADIERYVELVDRAECHYPSAMKMNLMEGVIFALAAPFASEVMRSRSSRTMHVNTRGPKHMVVYGDGHNGKTTYFRFLGHLLTGRVIEPVSGKNMAKSDWEGLLQLARHMQTCMPIFVDDIKERALKGKTANLEHQIKTHWENDWMPDRNYPLMMLNTNYDGMEEWAKSRVTRLDFHVKFNDDQRSHRVLQEILSRPNDVFGAFAAQTTSLPEGSLDTGMDELAWARSVLKELYALAERDLPTFFPHVPPSEVFDMDALYCSSRIKYGLARLKRKRRAWMLIFQSRQSMFAFKARLPHTVSSSVDDKTLLIEPQSVPAMKRFLKAAKSSSR